MTNRFTFIVVVRCDDKQLYKATAEFSLDKRDGYTEIVDAVVKSESDGLGRGAAAILEEALWEAVEHGKRELTLIKEEI